jgi:hypothetical protein
MRSPAAFIAQLCRPVGARARGRAPNPWHLVSVERTLFRLLQRKTLGVLQLRRDPLHRTPLVRRMPR